MLTNWTYVQPIPDDVVEGSEEYFLLRHSALEAWRTGAEAQGFATRDPHVAVVTLYLSDYDGPRPVRQIQVSGSALPQRVTFSQLRLDETERWRTG